MYDFLKLLSRRANLPPGSLDHPPEGQAPTVIDAVYYDSQTEDEHLGIDPASIQGPPADGRRLWLRVQGLGSPEVLQKVAAAFGLHPLLMEDVLNTVHRPKIEEFEAYLFVVLRLIKYDRADPVLRHSQVCLVMGDNWLITFEEKPSQPLDLVLGRLRQRRGRIVGLGVDYLTYAMLDMIVDGYFVSLAEMVEAVERLEQRVLEDAAQVPAQLLYETKAHAGRLRRLLWPLREVASYLNHEDSGLFSEAVHPYLRDLYDHTMLVVEAADSIRDEVAGLVELHISVQGYRTNEVMRVLTVVSSIFIPLTFIAGVYGMNFEYMPELHWHWGYPVVLLVMAGIVTGMIFFFKRKKWL